MIDETKTGAGEPAPARLLDLDGQQLYRTSAGEQVVENYYCGNNQQDVNEVTRGTRDHTQQPKHQDHNEDRPKNSNHS